MSKTFKEMYESAIEEVEFAKGQDNYNSALLSVLAAEQVENHNFAYKESSPRKGYYTVQINLSSTYFLCIKWYERSEDEVRIDLAEFGRLFEHDQAGLVSHDIPAPIERNAILVLIRMVKEVEERFHNNRNAEFIRTALQELKEEALKDE